METFENLEVLLRTFWFIAIPASIIFIIQSIMTFMGSDSSDGFQADFDSNLDATDSPFQLFSLRNLINFLLGFSWSGISFYTVVSNKTLLISLALAVGILFVYIFFLIMNQVQKLAEDNSFKISTTLNKTAEVYLTIPEKRKGKGKILISVNGSFHELEAITDNEHILSGSTVKVIRIDNEGILVVEII